MELSAISRNAPGRLRLWPRSRPIAPAYPRPLTVRGRCLPNDGELSERLPLRQIERWPVRLELVIRAAFVTYTSAAGKVIIDEGSCNINIQGDNNRIDHDVFRNACLSRQVELLKQSGRDGFSDFCLTTNRVTLGRKFCSIAFDRLKSRYAFGNDEGHMLITGRYTGEIANGVPYGTGEFVVSDLSVNLIFMMSFVGDPNLYDEFQKGKTLLMEGQWRNGLFTGEGELIFPMGGTMKGRFQNSVLLEGRATNIPMRSLGLVLLFNGDRYTGPIRNGKLHGSSGEIIDWTDSDGDGHAEYTLIERGRFSDGELYHGERILSKGQSRETVWIETFRNGKYIKSKKFYRHFTIDRCFRIVGRLLPIPCQV